MRLSGLFAIALVAWAPTPAAAWTEANVESIAARVDVDAEGHAEVDLILTVRIGGGWLEGLDVDGLDPDLVLSEGEPPWARSLTDESLSWTPRVRVRDGGAVRLSFPDRGSPRRGRIQVGLSYATDLAGRNIAPVDDGRIRISWTLPGWRTGIDGVEVTLVTPTGAEPAASMDEGSEAADEHEEVEAEGTIAHTFRRIHLPRTMPWTVAVDLPAESMAPALRGPSVAAPRVRAERAPGDSPGESVLALVLLVLLASLGARASHGAACRARGLTPRPLVPGPLWLVAPGAAALTALCATQAHSEPLLAVALLAPVAALALSRAPRRPEATALRFSPCPRRTLDDARRPHLGRHLLGSPVMDPTTLFGALAFVLLVFCAVTLGGLATRPSAFGLACLGLLGIPFVATTRFHLPPTAFDELRALSAFAEARGDIGPAAMRLVLGRSPNGTGFLPRLRLVTDAPRAGLMRLDVLMVPRAVLGGFELEPMLLVVTDDGSPAEAVVVDAGYGSAFDGPGGRRARLVALPAEEADRILARIVTASTDDDETVVGGLFAAAA